MWFKWNEYLKIVIPIAICFYLTSLVFEVNAVFAALFHQPVQLAAHIALSNTSGFFFCIAFGVNVTCTTYIGISAGENRPNSAKTYAIMGLSLTLLICLILEIIVYTFRETWSQSFGDDPELQALLITLSLIYQVQIFPGSFQNPLMGILKPLGKGDAALKSYFQFYTILGLPLTYLIAFRMDLRTPGLWISYCLTDICNDLSLVYIMITTDWKQQI